MWGVDSLGCVKTSVTVDVAQPQKTGMEMSKQQPYAETFSTQAF